MSSREALPNDQRKFVNTTLGLLGHPQPGRHFIVELSTIRLSGKTLYFHVSQFHRRRRPINKYE